MIGLRTGQGIGLRGPQVAQVGIKYIMVCKALIFLRCLTTLCQHVAGEKLHCDHDTMDAGSHKLPSDIPIPDGIAKVYVQLGANYNPVVPPTNDTFVILIDASPAVAFALRLRFKNTANVYVIWSAIANQSGSVRFFDNLNTHGAGLALPVKEEWKHSVVRSVEVPVHPLNDVLELIPERLPIVFLKVNIEGYDLIALKTAGSHLERVGMIQIEADLNTKLYDVDEPNHLEDFQGYLMPLGFQQITCVEGVHNLAVYPAPGFRLQVAARPKDWSAAPWIHCIFAKYSASLTVTDTFSTEVQRWQFPGMQNGDACFKFPCRRLYPKVARACLHVDTHK